MQNKLRGLLMLLIVLLTFTSCELIEGIFKAGMGVGIIIVVVILALVIFVISKISGKK